jgi:hypothetical protein
LRRDDVEPEVNKREPERDPRNRMPRVVWPGEQGSVCLLCVLAQYLLGHAYEKGEGVPKDLEKAAELYQKAEEKGSKPAGICLWRLRNPP